MPFKKKKKITLVEAQDLYAKNEALREFLESKFSKEELTATSPQEEEETLEQKFKRVWEEKILTQCDSVRFLDTKWCRPSKTPTSGIEVLDKKGQWLFTYNYHSKNKTLRYSAFRVQSLLRKEVSSNVVILEEFIKSWADRILGIQEVMPGFIWVKGSQIPGVQGAKMPLVHKRHPLGIKSTLGV